MKLPLALSTALLCYQTSQGFVIAPQSGRTMTSLSSSAPMRPPQGTMNNSNNKKKRRNAAHPMASGPLPRPAGADATAAAEASLTKKKKNKSSKKKSKRKIIEKDASLTFAVMDLDNNGYVTPDEFALHMTRANYHSKDIGLVFAKLDSNQDGQVSFEEFREAMIALPILQNAPGLGRYPSAKTETSWLEDLHKDADQLFQTVDSDGNGFVDEFEFTSHLRRRSSLAAAGASAPAHEQQSTSSWSEEAVQKIFDLLDVNKNRRISKPEFRAAFVRYSSLRFAMM